MPVSNDKSQPETSGEGQVQLCHQAYKNKCVSGNPAENIGNVLEVVVSTLKTLLYLHSGLRSARSQRSPVCTFPWCYSCWLPVRYTPRAPPCSADTRLSRHMSPSVYPEGPANRQNLTFFFFLNSFIWELGFSLTDLPPPPTQTHNIDSTWRICGYTLQYNSGYVENEVPVMMR